MTNAAHSPRPATAPRNPVTFRRTGTTLTVTVQCEDATHKVIIASDGTPTYQDHDAADLAFLHSMGATDTTPCEAINLTAVAAQAWLDRRLRLTAPKGRFHKTSKQWRADEPLPCCDSGVKNPYVAHRNASGAAQQKHADVHPGWPIAHARTIDHFAYETTRRSAFTVHPTYLRKIAAFMCDARGITLNPVNLPDASRDLIRSLLPQPLTEQSAQITDTHVEDLWRVGLTMEFIEAVVAIFPAYDDSPPGSLNYWLGYEKHGLLRLLSLLRGWWRLGLTPEWITTVGTACANLPAEWVEQVQHWAPFTADTVVPYLQKGVTDNLPDLIYASTTPAVAAAFEALRPAGQEEWASLGLWLKSDYTLATATTIVRLKPTAVPLALRDLRGFLSRSHFFDRQALPVENTLARCQILAALIGTPGRTQNWFDTILPIEVIVTALADGLTPAVAVKRFERANRQ